MVAGNAGGLLDGKAMLVLNAMTMLSAVTPGWTGDERGTLAKAIGVTGTFPRQGSPKKLAYKSLNFTFVNNGNENFSLIIASDVATAPAPLPALTKQQARAEVQALLNDLDRFRTTSMFKQCIYGCGDKNPATAWNAKRDALQGQLGQQRDLPVMLKAAPGYLWSLGMAYGKNNAKDIKDYRDMVEEGLTD